MLKKCFLSKYTCIHVQHTHVYMLQLQYIVSLKESNICFQDLINSFGSGGLEISKNSPSSQPVKETTNETSENIALTIPGLFPELAEKIEFFSKNELIPSNM